MKYISLFILLMFLFTPDIFAVGYDQSAHNKVVSSVDDAIGIIFVIMKILGFLILIFALLELTYSSNGKSGSDKAVNSATKIVLSSFFMGAGAIYDYIKK